MEDLAQVKAILQGRSSRKQFLVGDNEELSASCFLGLMVTIHTALGLVKYVSEDLQYSYLMTRRINQDALEVC